jgi:hypothetical protein
MGFMCNFPQLVVCIFFLFAVPSRSQDVDILNPTSFVPGLGDDDSDVRTVLPLLPLITGNLPLAAGVSCVAPPSKNGSVSASHDDLRIDEQIYGHSNKVFDIVPFPCDSVVRSSSRWRVSFKTNSKLWVQVEDRWYFWLIIGLLAAFFIVLTFFTVRGFRRWHRHKKLMAAEAALPGNIELGHGGPPPGPDAIEQGPYRVSIDVPTKEMSARKSTLGQISLLDEMPSTGSNTANAVDAKDLQRRVVYKDRAHHRRGSSFGAWSSQGSAEHGQLRLHSESSGKVSQGGERGVDGIGWERNRAGGIHGGSGLWQQRSLPSELPSQAEGDEEGLAETGEHKQGGGGGSGGSKNNFTKNEDEKDAVVPLV